MIWKSSANPNSPPDSRPKISLATPSSARVRLSVRYWWNLASASSPRSASTALTLRFAIPAHLRTQAAALIPWQTEADLYRSDLRDRLPHGLTIPRAAAVRDLDADSAALWLEQVPARQVVWDLRRHARAAYLLGRLAASRAVAPLATAVHGARTLRSYADAWLAHIVLPVLAENGAWAHPLVRDAFDARLRHRLLTAADALPALLGELDDAPAATAHGDACTANLLLAGDRDALVMVDLGFCGQAPLGTDLGQLIVGEVQTGQRHPPTCPAWRRRACPPTSPASGPKAAPPAWPKSAGPTRPC